MPAAAGFLGHQVCPLPRPHSACRGPARHAHWVSASKAGRERAARTQRGWGLAHSSSLVKAVSQGLIASPCVSVHVLRHSHRAEAVIPTGRMKAVSGGSCLEYLSIHCSSSRMDPASKAVRSEESQSRTKGSSPRHQGRVPGPFHPGSHRWLPPVQRVTPQPTPGMMGKAACWWASQGLDSQEGTPGARGPSDHPHSTENYLSGPPWQRSAEWPGLSRRPAVCTGSGEGRGGKKS